MYTFMNKYLKYILPILAGLIVAGTVYGVSVFNSQQLAPNPQNGNCLTTNGGNPGVNAWSSCGSGGGGSGSTTIAGLTPSDGNFVLATGTDTNIGITISTTSPRTITFTPTFTGTLAAARLNSNVVQTLATGTAGTIFNGSISAQTLTLNLPFASAANTGQLQAADWTAFNNKVGTVSTSTSGNNFNAVITTGNLALTYPVNIVNNVSTGTSGTIFNISTSTNGSASALVLNLPTASAVNTGQLSASDWSRFNAFNAAWSIGLNKIFNATSTDSVLIGTSTPTTGQLTIQGSGTKNPLEVASSSGASVLTVFSSGQVLMGNGPINTQSALTVSTLSTDTPANLMGVISLITAAATTGSNNRAIRGLNTTVTVGATNTQDWTNNFSFSAAVQTASIASGAVGTFTGLLGNNITVSNLSANATTTNGYLYLANFGSVTGPIISAAGMSLYGLGQSSTNSVGLQLTVANSLPAIPTGRFGIYDSTGYTEYLAGNTGIGTSTPGQALVVVGSTTITSLGAGCVTSTASGALAVATCGTGTVTSVSGAGSIISSGGTTPTIQLQNLTSTDVLFGQGNSTIATSSSFTYNSVSNTLFLASSTISGFLTVTGTSTLATTTITGSTTISSLGAALVQSLSGGALASYAGSSCGAGTRATSINALGVLSCSSIISQINNGAGTSGLYFILAGSGISIATTSTSTTVTATGSGSSQWTTGLGLVYNGTNLGSTTGDSVLVGTTTPTTANFFVMGSSTKTSIATFASSSGQSYFQVLPSGAVTIGTTTPFLQGSGLTISGDSTHAAVLQLYSISNNVAELALGNLAGTNLADVFIQSALGSSYGGPSSLNLLTATSSPIAFLTNSSSVPKMIILSNGNVGINTTTPTTTLAVYGSGTTDILVVASSSNASILTVWSNGGMSYATSTNNGTTTVTYAGQYFSAYFDNGTSTATTTIDWAKGNTQRIGLASTGAISILFANQKAGGRYLLMVQSATTTAQSINWPSAVHWPAATAPTLSSGTYGTTDIVTFVCGGGPTSNCYAGSNLNYSP